MVSGNRSRMRTHALDTLERFLYRFDNFYFPSKSMIFENFKKSLKNYEINENPLILAQVTYPGWLAADRSRGASGAREEGRSARGVAAGVPEASNGLGMLLVMSLPISMSVGGP